MQTVTNLLINGAAGVTVGGTGATIKYFPAVPGASIGVANNNYGWLFVPGTNRANGQSLRVIASGVATLDAAGSPSATFTLAAAKNLTSKYNPNAQPSAAPAVSLTAIAAPVHAASGLLGSFPWSFEANLNADSTSGILQGRFTSVIDGVVENDNTATTLVTGVDMSQPTPLGFVFGVTFSVSEAGNSATMYQFSLEQ